ncbi:MAG TPA: hypothetical protein VKA95_06835 [Nitrososphaeraceae archaeon]|nr:hypothetical protein [Nitrososphaeraceae archaeon]
MLLSPIKETPEYLSSITIMLYVKEIFENWTQVVNKNKNTKPTKQVKTAGDSIFDGLFPVYQLHISTY